MCALVMLIEYLLEKNAEAVSPCVGQAVMERLGPVFMCRSRRR